MGVEGEQRPREGKGLALGYLAPKEEPVVGLLEVRSWLLLLPPWWHGWPSQCAVWTVSACQWSWFI